LVVIQSNGSRQPLFLVHQVNGLCLEFFRLAPYLGKDQPLYGLQSRGLNDGEEPISRLEEMAAHYIDLLCSAQPTGPYLIGGYSMGGNVAYEMGRQLRAAGKAVSLLMIIDAPVTFRDTLPQDDAGFMLKMLGRWGISVDQLPFKAEQFRELGLDEQLGLILELAKSGQVLEPSLS